MSTLENIIAAPQGDPEAPIEIAEIAIPILETLPAGVTIGTSMLLQRMGAKFHQIKPLSRWLYAARYDGYLDGWFTINEKRLAYGKPTVDWHNKRKAK